MSTAIASSLYSVNANTTSGEDSLIKELNFSSVLVESREHAFKSLQKVYDWTTQPNQAKGARLPNSQEQYCPTTSNMILLAGLSGTGKSMLVQDLFFNEIKMQAKAGKGAQPNFVVGKGDEKSGSEPYSVITDAFDDFAKGFVDSATPESVVEAEWLRTVIEEKLGADAIKLGNIVPALRPFLGTHDGIDTSNSDRGTDENSWNRVRYVFQAFVNAISTAKRPLVLFIDDLQWIDEASLKLIYSLLIDHDLKHFMFVGAYRADEVHSGDVLWKTLERVQIVQDYETIRLSNLSKKELFEYVTHVLQMKNKRSRKSSVSNVAGKEASAPEDIREELVSLLHKKTDGNLFFATQCIKQLENREILSFSPLSFQWEMNWSSVDQSEFLTDDVMSMVQEKIKNCSDTLQAVLKTMAFTTSPTSIAMLKELLGDSDTRVSSSDLVEVLEDGSSQGLLVRKIGTPDYAFAHDKIQEAGKIEIMQQQLFLCFHRC